MSARLQHPLPYTLDNGTPGELTVSYTDPAQISAPRPPIIFVHGFRSGPYLWESGPPAKLPAPDSSSHAGPPLQLIPRVVQISTPWTDPRGLWEAVEQAGFPGLSWQQNDDHGDLPGNTNRELAAVVDFALQTYQARQVFLIGHSRGGLVCRAYLMDSAVATKVAVLVTIATPHWGSRLPALPGQIEGEIAKAILGTFGLPGKLVAMFATPLAVQMINNLSAGFTGDLDLLAWKASVNPRLQRIMVASRYTHIRYVAVAGVYPHLDDARIYYYTPASLVPHGFPPRFQWQEMTYPPADQPPAPLTLLLGELAGQLEIGTVTAMPEVYPDDGRRPEGGDGAVGKHSAWFGDEESDPAQGYVKNLKFPYGHSLLPRRPEVQQAILAELALAT